MKKKYLYINDELYLTGKISIDSAIIFDFIKNKDKYSEESYTNFVCYIKKTFLKLFFLAYKESDNASLFSFFKEHNMTQDKSLFTKDKRDLSLYLEILILRDDLEGIKYLLANCQKKLFIERAFLFAMRYKNKDILELLVNANYNLNYKIYVGSSFYDPNYAVKDYLKLKAEFDSRLSLLIKENIEDNLINGRFKFKDYDQESNNELKGFCDNTEDILLDNLKFLILKNAISHDLVSHLYFSTILYNREKIRAYFESINVELLNADISNLLYRLSESNYPIFVFLNVEAKRKFIDNLNFILKRGLLQKAKLDIYFDFSNLIYLYTEKGSAYTSYIEISDEDKIVYDKICNDDFLLYLFKKTNIILKEDEINIFFYENLILSKMYQSALYLLDSKKVPFKDYQDELNFFYRLIEISKRENRSYIMPFVLERIKYIKEKIGSDIAKNDLSL